MSRLIVLFLLLANFGNTTLADSKNLPQDPKFLIHLLDYISRDYAGAVSPGGIIQSQGEFDEQVEFIQICESIAKSNPSLSNDKTLQASLAKLKSDILSKSEPRVVSQEAIALRNLVLSIGQISESPSQWPNLGKGKSLYAKACAVCHGATGNGDGPGSAGLDPAPSAFSNAAAMSQISPFQASNTIRNGVPGTGMPGFTDYSDDEVWSLAFYLSSLRFGEKLQSDHKPSLTLEELSEKNDGELLQKHSQEILAQARLYDPGDETFLVGSTGKARKLLDEAILAYEAQDFRNASESSLSAYLDGIEPIEPKLGSLDPKLLSEVERAMALMRKSIGEQVPLERIRELSRDTNALLLKVDEVLKNDDQSPATIASWTAGIFAREALEAVLIIIALLAAVRRSDHQSAEKWIHAGWISAVGLGFIGWFFSGILITMSGIKRELLEGFVTILAVTVLLAVGFWMHQKSEIEKWKKYIDTQIRVAIERKSVWGFFLISFFAVFREAFETVLFLRSLTLESGQNAGPVILSTVLVIGALVLFFARAILRKSAKLPVAKIFSISSALLAALAVVLAGKAIHSLQEAGVVPMSGLELAPRLELIGLYPTMETVLLQVAVILAIGFLWVMGKRSSLHS